MSIELSDIKEGVFYQLGTGKVGKLKATSDHYFILEVWTSLKSAEYGARGGEVIYMKSELIKILNTHTPKKSLVLHGYICRGMFVEYDPDWVRLEMSEGSRNSMIKVSERTIEVSE